MKKNYNIAIVGLGQVGLYLYNELKIKKKDIETKTGKQIKIDMFGSIFRIFELSSWF